MLPYSVMKLSKDIFRRYWYYSSSAFSSFSSSRNRPFAEDTWRREFTCMHTLLFSSVVIVETLYLVRSLD